jgi:histidinol-phosphatase (PHP family)
MSLPSFQVYAREVRALGEKYRDRIPVFLGLELDYHPGLDNFYAAELLSRGLDYVVASVHYVDGAPGDAWNYDESAAAFDREVRQRYGGDARPAVEDYYRRMQQLVSDSEHWRVPVVVGHFDRIVLWNRGDRYFPTDNAWYERLVDDTIAAIAATSCVLEINTSGWDKPCEMSNPSPAILRRASKAGLPVIVSADAHRPANVAVHFDRALGILKESGFTRLVTPSSDGWHSVPLV